jgi:hypothetical protein
VDVSWQIVLELDFGVPNGEESDDGDLHGERVGMDGERRVLLREIDSDEVARWGSSLDESGYSYTLHTSKVAGCCTCGASFPCFTRRQINMQAVSEHAML